MKTVLGVTFTILLFHASKVESSEKCLAILKPDFNDCSDLKHYDEHPGECSSSKACQKHFKVTAIIAEPFIDMLQRVIFSAIASCCGHCKKLSEKDTIKISPDNISLSLMNTTNFVYPVLGENSERSIYGYHFIPIVEMSSGIYIERRVTPKQVMLRLITSCLNLWPLLVIIVLLAVITGFIMWLTDTWSNKGEFSRQFIYGWADGFWWSFVSMTTVGYGDKVPKHVCSRFFSVIWILVGITIISIFVAALTNDIMSAANPDDPDMHGKHVGVLKDRTFDAVFVAKHGGIIEETKGTTEKENIADIKRLLSSGKVDGIFLDKYTYMFTVAIAKDGRHNKEHANHAEHADLDTANFFLYETDKVAKDFKGVRVAYGVLVKEEEDFRFFEEFINHNRVLYEACASLKLNELEEVVEEDHDIFRPKGGVFYEFLYGCLAVIGGIIIFGLVFEGVQHFRKVGLEAIPNWLRGKKSPAPSLQVS